MVDTSGIEREFDKFRPTLLHCAVWGLTKSACDFCFWLWQKQQKEMDCGWIGIDGDVAVYLIKNCLIHELLQCMSSIPWGNSLASHRKKLTEGGVFVKCQCLAGSSSAVRRESERGREGGQVTLVLNYWCVKFGRTCGCISQIESWGQVQSWYQGLRK